MDDLQVKGNWNKIKGKAKELYGSITDDKLKEYEGKYDQLVGFLQEKTGKTRDEVKSKLEDFQEGSEAHASEEKESAREH
ncbi:MAG: CsbD family protein [Ignavibacteriae bacterium]|nr:CsbD family protein [Ignavibacteriota bacterium]